MNETEFKAHLRKKEFSNLYFIYGEEKFMVRRYSDELVKKTVGEKPSEFNFHEPASDAQVEEIAVADDIMPFASPYNFVKVSDYDIQSLVKSDAEALIQVFKNIPKTTILLFTFPTSNPSGQTWITLLNAVKKIGVAVEFEHLTKLKLGAALVDGAYKRGCSMSENTADMLIEYCGSDLSSLRNELDKLCAYADGQEITPKMIELLVEQNQETKLYYFTDKIMYGNIEKAYEDLSILLYQKIEPIVIVSAIGGAYIDLYRAKVTLESGVPLSTAAEEFGYGKRKFVLEKAAKRAKNMSMAQIRKSIDEIMQVDIALKSTSIDSRTAIEKLIAKLLLIRGQYD